MFFLLFLSFSNALFQCSVSLYTYLLGHLVVLFQPFCPVDTVTVLLFNVFTVLYLCFILHKQSCRELTDCLLSVHNVSCWSDAWSS